MMTINPEVKNEILALLKNCDLKTMFDKHYDDDFTWTIKGTSVLSGSYHSKQEFLTAFGRLSSALQPNIKLHVLDTYEDKDTLILEMKGQAKTLKGTDYNNEYCWILKFRDNKVVKTIAYYDSLLVNNTLT